MNKPIIIDDVNVAECEFLRNCIIPDNYGCKIDDSLCCDVGNCYYKQLQRLKAENKLLEEEKRDKIELLGQVINILYPNASDNELYDVAFNIEFIDKLKELKAENEELKTKIFDEGLRRKTCKYYKQVCSENTQLIAYRNALEEVHNLLSQSMDIKLKSADKHFSLIDEAIEKVNEVLK